MHVLFLDDDPRRTALIHHHLDGHCELTTVDTAHACIECLAANDYDLILLDHDLGGEIFCDSSREDCGMEVVRWVTSSPGRPTHFILHSHNSVAAREMAAALAALGHEAVAVPFGSPEFFEVVDSFVDELTGTKRRGRRLSLGDRIRRYFRSLRLGR